MKRTIQVITVFIAAAITHGALAATVTWTGDDVGDPTNWAVGANWDTGQPPADDDYSDIAAFTENAAANKTPTLAGTREVNRIEFDNSTGWQIGGSQIAAKSLSSTGVGTNRINSFSGKNSTVQINVGVGNVLELRLIYQDNGGSNMVLSGGGTLVLETKINGWSANLDFSISDGLLRVEDDWTYRPIGSDNRKTYLTSEDAVLELQTTVSAAENLITNGQIVDNTGMGGLAVTDMGNGYVQIAAIPEPASLILLAAGGLLIASRRR